MKVLTMYAIWRTTLTYLAINRIIINFVLVGEQKDRQTNLEVHKLDNGPNVSSGLYLHRFINNYFNNCVGK